MEEEVTNKVIDIKIEIENIREQVQNIEWKGIDFMQLVNIGFGNIVSAERIVAIVSPESAPIKRLVQEARDDKTIIDATYGRKTRAVLIMDSGHIILSAVQPETVGGRIDKNITQEELNKLMAETIK